MYELKPVGWPGWEFDVTRDGVSIGSLHLAFLKSSAALTINGRKYDLRREGMFGPLLLNEGERSIARAERRRILAPSYALILQDRELLVKTQGFLMRTATVLHGDVVHATIHRKTFFGRTFTIESDGTLPEEAVLFGTVVMILLWRRRSRSNN